MPRKRRSYPAELKAKVALRRHCARKQRSTERGRARYGVHPNLITNWKTKRSAASVLTGLSGNHERQEASREAEIQPGYCGAKYVPRELVIESRGFFIQGLRSVSHGRRARTLG